MPNTLFQEFETITSKQWKQQIQFELKGLDYGDTLVWESPEGIKVKPFYHKDEDFKTNSSTTQATNFKIVQNIFVYDVEKSIKKAKNALLRGADSLRFTVADDTIEISKLLSEIDLEKTTIYINLQFLSIDFIKKNKSVCRFKKRGDLLSDRSSSSISI